MTRVRSRYFDSYRALQPRRSGKVLRGQRFGKASEVRRPPVSERNEIERRLKEQGIVR
jgi:hypothetical protein